MGSIKQHGHYLPITSGCCTFREGLDVHALTVREDPQGANLPVDGAPIAVVVNGSLTLDEGTNEFCSCYGGTRIDRDKHKECFEESDEDVYAWNESAGNTGPCTYCECHDFAYGTRKSDTLTISYAQQFANEHEIETVVDRPEAMIGQVDAVILHGCNWDRHVASARPFVEAGVPVLVDKPVAGNERDLRQFERWVENGACITGGSSLRFCDEVRQWRAQPLDVRGEANTVICGCGVDEFNYGIHAYALLHAVLGGGATRVRHISQGPQRRIQVEYPDGRCGILVIGQAKTWLPFYATITTDRSIQQIVVDNSRIYRSLLEATLPYLVGQTKTPPLPSNEWLDPERWALAARESWLNDNRWVDINALSSDAAGYDGSAFAQQYRSSRT
ncbi:Gfo/Idh/MocA family oxidoreductase [Phycisphaerales bacterium AB-hyl4]|uniref:Gfo/Idh/MocA family oxidoreductase n=1 Tax=Natronomicrosphaera hydrolytica TaxID=3242702 RepID=A0ABV4U800_9BACT